MRGIVEQWRAFLAGNRQARALGRLRRRDEKFVRRAEQFEAHFVSPLGPSTITDRALRFSHAGNAGDVIFALPTLRAISADRPAELFLQIDRPAFYAEGKHPLGNLRLNSATAGMLAPLIGAQAYIARCAVHDAQEIDYALDLFRDAPLPGDKGYLARWPMYIWGVNYDLSLPWLVAQADPAFADTIVIARSQRYRNPLIDYRFLARYQRLAFIGVDEEFDEVRKVLPNLERVPIPDFLQMARVIAGARVFVGNQSLPYSIAEALKTYRVLEACHRAPTNVAHGLKGCDAYFQRHFEFAIRQFYER